MPRSLVAIIGVLLAVLVPLGFATDDGPTRIPAAADPRPTTAVPEIARRVERLRGRRFRAVPEPVRVSAEQAQKEGLADLDRGYPADRRRADEALYTLLGLLPPGTDLRDVGGSIFGEQVAGYYDPRSKDLRIVEGAATSNRVLDEMVIAHELTHALDDQRVGIDQKRSERSDDGGTAYLAVVEGIATQVMFDYVDRHFDAETALGGLLGGAFAEGSGGGELPPFILASLTFPYVTGQAFVRALLDRAGGRWTLVDLAERSRPPESTEQVLHPEKWIAVEPPLDVDLDGLRGRLGDGHERLTAGVLGEWGTGELLALSGRPQAQAAAGWGGDRYELWRRDAGTPCETPCTARDTLVLRWRWDTAADAREFVTALRETLEDGLGADPRGSDDWALRDAAVALSERGGEVTLAFAPDPATARRVIL